MTKPKLFLFTWFLLPLFACSSSGQPDSVRPNAISDLQLESVTETAVSLSWTAPGDDGDRGSAASYDFRFSQSPLPANWETATSVSLPSPKMAGAIEETTLSDLEKNSVYFFALKTEDEAGNLSEFSNILEVQTGDFIAPNKITDLAISQIFPHSVRLSFTAPGDDGDQGMASSYAIRFSDTAIDSVTWEAATRLPVNLVPSTPGSVEEFNADGFSPETSVYFAVRATDDAGLTAPVSNEVLVSFPSDDVPPGPIVDLSVVPGRASAILEWSAPGNDGYMGQATAYRIRYLDSEITEGNWISATEVSNALIPQNPGGSESFQIPNLPEEAHLWFAVRAVDDAGNLGGLSNETSGFIDRASTTIVVRQDGKGHSTSIQGGIDLSQSEDIVLVHPGTYFENINFNGKDIHLKSLDGPETTIIDGSGTADSVVKFESMETRAASLDGFTIRGGSGTQIQVAGIGGGICISDGSPTVLNNIITENHVTIEPGFGGGIAIFTRFGDVLSAPVITNNVVSHNSASFNGGGATIGDSKVVLSGNTFLGNESGFDGGAIRVAMGKAGSVVIVDNSFVENIANDHGGAIETQQMVPGSPPMLIRGNLFLRNQALGTDPPGGNGTGGAISMRGWEANIENNTFVENVGTGLNSCSGGSLLISMRNVAVRHNIFASSQGCAISCRATEGVSVESNLFWDNSPMDAGGFNDCIGSLQEQNTFANPIFCNPANGDFRVRSDSPALVGVPIGAFATPGCSP